MAKLYGKGTITEIVKGKKYRVSLSCGRDPITGKYRRVQETFLGTRRQAELRVEQIRREVESGKRPDADKITFAEWCEEYLTTREAMGKLRTNTYKADRSYSRHLVRGLGDARVVEIMPADVSRLYVSMREAGVGDTTLLQCHRLLKKIMRAAVDNDLIMRNPVDRVETPRKPKPKRNALTTQEARRLGAVASDGMPTANTTAVFLGLSLGARLGEVLGLTWEHVDLDAPRPYVHIVQQHTSNNERTPLKTDADENPVGRIVPLDHSTVTVLATWKDEQRRELNRLGIEQATTTPVVTNSIGGFTDHHNFTQWWREFCVQHGFGRWVSNDGRRIVDLVIGDDASLYPGCVVEWRDADSWPCDETGRRFSRSYKRPVIKRHYEGLTFHELRHTHFTMRLASGMDIPTAQALGGWSTPDVLMSVYAHPVTENIWASVGFMDGLSAPENGRFGSGFAHDLLNLEGEEKQQASRYAG